MAHIQQIKQISTPMENFKPNQKRYEKLSKPVSKEKADEQIKAFSQAVYKLREKHKITELVFCAGINVEGGEVLTSVGQCGDVIVGANLANYCYKFISNLVRN